MPCSMRVATTISLVAPHIPQRCHSPTVASRVSVMVPASRFAFQIVHRTQQRSSCERLSSVVVHASNDNSSGGVRRTSTTVSARRHTCITQSTGQTPFGYTRKDVILIGTGLIGLGYGMYYGLQATGMDAGMAGNFVQLIIFVGICIGWIGSYLFRVANKVGHGRVG